MIQTRLQKLPSFSAFKKSIFFLYLNEQPIFALVVYFFSL